MKTRIFSVSLRLADIEFQISADPGIFPQIIPRHQAFVTDPSAHPSPNTPHIPLHLARELPDPIESPIRIWEVADGPAPWKVFDYPQESRIFLYFPGQEPWQLLFRPYHRQRPFLLKVVGKETIVLLPYPLDILLLYLVSTRHPLLLVHGSGFVLNSRGFVCLGRSGAGKTSILNLAQSDGGLRIQDDRLIIRLIKNSWVMFPLPLSSQDRPVAFRIHRLLALFHGAGNLALPCPDHLAINHFLPHLVQFPQWRWYYQQQLSLMNSLLKSVRIAQFYFTPNQTAIDYLKNGKSAHKTHSPPPSS